MIIGIDFDGTVVTHEFPRLGKDVGAIPVLKELRENGHRLVLFTMRDKHYLEQAVEYLKINGVDLFGVNINPEQTKFTTSPKAYCNIYIDDAALGCPLIYGKSDRPFVDWKAVREMLEDRGLL